MPCLVKNANLFNTANCLEAFLHISETQLSNFNIKSILKIVSQYDQEIPQSQTAYNPMAPRGRAAQPTRDTRLTN